MAEEMDMEKLAKNGELIKKYHDLIFSIPGLMLLGWNDKEIHLEVKPEKVELTKKFVVSDLEGVPVKVLPRSNPPSF
ncbi:MAG TPA: hypothetical protein VNG29_02950 [Candidatus Paceibacterota bacterium]|nr:hypothetical protein [Candidatus Paceibacterota bacterium]